MADALALLKTSAASLSTAFGALVWPALVFAAIALLARGVDAVRVARAASAEVRTNLALFALDVVCITPVLALSLGATGAWIQQHGLRLPVDWSALPVWMVALIAVFAGDFIGYWRHRLEHAPALWPGHAIHHSDTAMTWTTGLRFHPINRFSTALIDTTSLALLGLPPWALVANNLVRHYYGLFIHMDLPWTYGPLGRLLVSPAMHRWHHIRDADGAGVNFATVFSVFDQAFRTYSVPGPCAAPLGVRDPVGAGVLAQLAWPLKALGCWLSGHSDGLRRASESAFPLREPRNDV
jgi:sterol desaturase/sphingolipid hydroxylase (fatty acid hydroxylase superfamily)